MSENPAAMTERLIDAAIYAETASGCYVGPARKELNESRAAIEGALIASNTQLDAANERCDELTSLIRRVEPHIDAIVCYASTMGEHEPNRIAHEVRAIAGRTQDERVGEAIAAQIIARIDADHPAPQEETGWLVELKGQTPSWSTLFAGDFDDHWTDDSTKALRFARKVDAEAFIAWHGWTEAFASEHIWQDGPVLSKSTPLSRRMKP